MTIDEAVDGIPDATAAAVDGESAGLGLAEPNSIERLRTAHDEASSSTNSTCNLERNLEVQEMTLKVQMDLQTR